MLDNWERKKTLTLTSQHNGGKFGWFADKMTQILKISTCYLNKPHIENRNGSP